MLTFAVRFDYATVLLDEPLRRRRVAEVVMHPCLDVFTMASTRRRDRWINRQPKTPAVVDAILADTNNRQVSLDPRRMHAVASGEIESGTRDAAASPTRFDAHLVFPVPEQLESTLAVLCELADALDTNAGFIAAEPDFSHALHAAFANALPKARMGVSERRQIERRGRHWHGEQLHAELAGPEWGTFLGAGHLARIDLETVRRSGAFHRVVSVTPRLAFLQVTSDPADDLRDDFEPKLQAAREVLAPLLMDLGDVNLD